MKKYIIRKFVQTTALYQCMMLYAKTVSKIFTKQKIR